MELLGTDSRVRRISEDVPGPSIFCAAKTRCNCPSDGPNCNPVFPFLLYVAISNSSCWIGEHASGHQGRGSATRTLDPDPALSARNLRRRSTLSPSRYILLLVRDASYDTSTVSMRGKMQRLARTSVVSDGKVGKAAKSGCASRAADAADAFEAPAISRKGGVWDFRTARPPLIGVSLPSCWTELPTTCSQNRMMPPRIAVTSSYGSSGRHLQIERLLLPCSRSVDSVEKEMRGVGGRAKQFAHKATAGYGYAISNNICRAAWEAHKVGGWTFRLHTPQRTVIYPRINGLRPSVLSVRPMSDTTPAWHKRRNCQCHIPVRR